MILIIDTSCVEYFICFSYINKLRQFQLDQLPSWDRRNQ